MLRPLDPRRCPVDQALALLSGKWKPLILWRLAGGVRRHGELMRSMRGVTQRMLTLQLRELERDGLVLRTAYAQRPPRVEYALTAPARELLPHLGALGGWLLEHHAALVGESVHVGQARGLRAEEGVRVEGVRVHRA